MNELQENVLSVFNRLLLSLHGKKFKSLSETSVEVVPFSSTHPPDFCLHVAKRLKTLRVSSLDLASNAPFI